MQAPAPAPGPFPPARTSARRAAPAMAAALLLALAGCALPSQTAPQGRPAPAGTAAEAGGIATLIPPEAVAVNESETTTRDGRFAVFSVTPRIEQHPAGTPYPLLLTTLGALQGRTNTTIRFFRATFAITYPARAEGQAATATAAGQSATARPAGRQRFDAITVGSHLPGPLRPVDHDLRCDTPSTCLYTETLATFLPEADLRAAAAANRALAFRLEGTMPVNGSIPPEQARALLAKVDAPAR